MTEREKAIVEIRAINYSWAELNPDARPGAIEAIAMKEYRVEIRREGETEWTEIPLIEVGGRPPKRVL
jgi:hypothetical protein